MATFDSRSHRTSRDSPTNDPLNQESINETDRSRFTLELAKERDPTSQRHSTAKETTTLPQILILAERHLGAAAEKVGQEQARINASTEQDQAADHSALDTAKAKVETLKRTFGNALGNTPESKAILDALSSQRESLARSEETIRLRKEHLEYAREGSKNVRQGCLNNLTRLEKEVGENSGYGFTGITARLSGALEASQTLVEKEKADIRAYEKYIETTSAQLKYGDEMHKQALELEAQAQAAMARNEANKAMELSQAAAGYRAEAETALMYSQVDRRDSHALNEKFEKQIGAAIDNLHTAETVARTTRDVCVVAAATIATGGAAAGAIASYGVVGGVVVATGAGTVVGTGVGALTNATEATGHILLGNKGVGEAATDALSQTGSDAVNSLQASAATAVGLGVSSKITGAIRAVAGGASSGLTSGISDTARNAANGELEGDVTKIVSRIATQTVTSALSAGVSQKLGAVRQQSQNVIGKVSAASIEAVGDLGIGVAGAAAQAGIEGRNITANDIKSQLAATIQGAVIGEAQSKIAPRASKPTPPTPVSPTRVVDNPPLPQQKVTIKPPPPPPVAPKKVVDNPPIPTQGVATKQIHSVPPPPPPTPKSKIQHMELEPGLTKHLQDSARLSLARADNLRKSPALVNGIKTVLAEGKVIVHTNSIPEIGVDGNPKYRTYPDGEHMVYTGYADYKNSNCDSKMKHIRPPWASVQNVNLPKGTERIHLSDSRKGERYISYECNSAGQDTSKRPAGYACVTIYLSEQKAEAVFKALRSNPDAARQFFIASTRDVPHQTFIWDGSRTDRYHAPSSSIIFSDELQQSVTRPITFECINKDSSGNWQTVNPDQDLINKFQETADKLRRRIQYEQKRSNK